MDDATVHGEEDIIQTYLRPLAAAWPGALDLRDDCAAITPAPGQDLIVKTDPIRAGVHFFADDAPADIAWKALAVNVSDLAAKASRPLAYTMALSFPEAPARGWLAAFAAGLGEAQDAFGCTLIGGDTDRAAGPLSIAVTIFGEVPHGRMVRRATAKAGDRIFVSGTLGDAALGLKIRWQDANARGATFYSDFALNRYLRPQPRLGLRAALRGFARAAMDISDGLPKDLGRMCRAAGLGASINATALPFSPALQDVAAADRTRAMSLVSGSDDYEILCAVPPENCNNFIATAKAGDVAVTEIGAFTSSPAVQLISETGPPVDWNGSGYDHFQAT